MISGPIPSPLAKVILFLSVMLDLFVCKFVDSF